MARILSIISLILVMSFPAFADKKKSGTTLDLSDRQITVSGKLTLSAAQKNARALLSYDLAGNAPIYVNISASRGTAQGVMLIADTIRGIKSPVVAVVTTNLHGAGAALAVMADRTVMYRSSGLSFTEVEYEGVQKYKAPPAQKPKSKGFKKKPKVRTAIQKYLQKVRKDYLGRFWNTVATRLKMKSDVVAKQVAAGGFSMLPADAVKNKVAHTVVDSITWTPMANISREVKTVVSEKKYRTVAPGK
jgi:hypothetical protein